VYIGHPNPGFHPFFCGDAGPGWHHTKAAAEEADDSDYSKTIIKMAVTGRRKAPMERGAGMTKRLGAVVTAVAVLVAIGVVPALANGEDPEAAKKVATILAEEFEVDIEAITDLHDEGIGYGAIFKLQALALALGVDVETLLADLTNESGEYAFGFGKFKKSLTEEQQAILDSLPRNLGQIVSAANKAEHAEHAGQNNGHGKPPWAGPHNQNDDDQNDDD
jgi:hypothetical protein